jgi:SAM-dependent methyltransferase
VSWTGLTEWWLSELEGDPAYDAVVTPLLLEVLQPKPGRRYIDLGCGEGRVMRAVVRRGGTVHGVDVNLDLAARAHPVVIARLPQIPVRDNSYDGAYSVLSLEHIPDHRGLFGEAARVTVPGGILGLVINHPIWTAPGSTPISDEDGEVLWRPGDYFSSGSSEVPAGDGTVTFFHRSTADLLNAASEAGWSLEHIVELPHHLYDDQAGIPRLLACRWWLGSHRAG